MKKQVLISSNDAEKVILDRFKVLLFDRVGVDKLILFGSRARGDAEPDSDMDVLVVVNDEATDQVKDIISYCAWEAGFEYGIIVVPVVFSKREWEEGPERFSLLSQVVHAEGIRI